jgi:hypothetical protein
MKKNLLILIFLVASIFTSSLLLSGCSNSGGLKGTYYSTLNKKGYVELFKKRRCYLHTLEIDSMGKWYMHKNRITMQIDSSVLHWKYLNGVLYLKVRGKIHRIEVIHKIPFKVSTKYVKKYQLKTITSNNHNAVIGKFKGEMQVYSKKMEPGFFGSYMQWVSSKTPVVLTIKGKNKVILSSKKKNFSPVKYRFKIYGDVLTISGSRNIYNYNGNSIDGAYIILKHKNYLALVNTVYKSRYFIKK